MPKIKQVIADKWHQIKSRYLSDDINRPYADSMYYAQADRLTINLLWWHLGILAALLLLNAVFQVPAVMPSPLGWRVIDLTEAAIAAAIAGLAIGATLWIYRQVQNHYHWRLAAALSLLIFGYLFIYVSGGAIEMHYQLLFIIFYFCLYADWRIHWIIFSLIAFQHIISDLLLLKPLNFYGLNSLSPAVNLTFFLVAAIFATIISRNYRFAVEGLVLAKQRNDQFIAIASHELRTPLTSIKGNLDIIYRRMKRHGDPSLERAEKIDEQLSKVNHLIKDLLDISTRHAGRVQLDIETISIETIIVQAVEEVQAAAHRHQIDIEGNMRILIQADRIRLGQLMVNLLTNAMKYSPHSDKIVIKVASSRDKVVVSVRDFGIGISRQDQRRIFEPYFRGSDLQRSQLPGGLGMGLYISNQIITSHQGRMWVESTPGQGTTFSFMIPKTLPNKHPLITTTITTATTA